MSGWWIHSKALVTPWWRKQDQKNVKTKKGRLNKQERERKKKENEINSLVREVSFYFIFLILLILTALNNRDTRAFGYRQGILNAINSEGVVNKIQNIEDVWKWIEYNYTSFMFPTTNWNGLPLTKIDREVATLASYRVGPVRLRQHRIHEEPCSLPSPFPPAYLRCGPGGQDPKWDYMPYEPGWKITNSTLSPGHDANRVLASETPTVLSSTPNPGSSETVTDGTGESRGHSSAWRYTTWSEIGGLPVAGELGVYPPGGYVKDIVGPEVNTRATLKELRDHDWLDERTYDVIVEVTLYNANSNLFMMVTVLFEVLQTDVIQGKIHMHPFRLFSYLGGYSTLRMVNDVLVYMVIVWFALREASQIYHQRLRYFRQFWNILEMLNLLTSITAIVMYIGRIYVTTDFTKQVKQMDGQFYNFQTLAKWDELFGILVGFVCFLSTIQMLHLLRFNRRMSLLGATLKEAGPDLASFAVFFAIAFFAFVSFCYMMFGSVMSEYSTIHHTVETLVVVSLGSFDYNLLRQVNRIFAPTFLFLYMLFIVFILINMLITILTDAFTVIRDDVSKQPNDHELIDYIKTKMVHCLWKSKQVRGVWSRARCVGIVSTDTPRKCREEETTPQTECLRREGRRRRYKSRLQKNVASLHNRLGHLQGLIRGREARKKPPSREVTWIDAGKMEYPIIELTPKIKRDVKIDIHLDADLDPFTLDSPFTWHMDSPRKPKEDDHVVPCLETAQGTAHNNIMTHLSPLDGEPAIDSNGQHNNSHRFLLHPSDLTIESPEGLPENEINDFQVPDAVQDTEPQYAGSSTLRDLSESIRIFSFSAEDLRQLEGHPEAGGGRRNEFV